MTVTQQRIGTGITERLSVSIHGPWDEATRDWAPRVAEAYNETNIFECRVAPWERWCQDVFAQEKLPPWNKLVRIYADGRSWADDLPEDWLQRWHDILRPGESTDTGRGLANRLYRVDSPVWFAGEILSNINAVRQARASHNEESALCRAMDVSELITTARDKFSWEAEVSLGKAHRRASSKGGKGRVQSTREDHVKWQQRANTILDDHPDMPWSRVISKVAAEFNKSPSTVRKYIRNPKRQSVSLGSRFLC